LNLGSHLCDIKGCVSADHLIMEDFSFNLSRQKCQGALLFLRGAGSTSPAQLIQSTACRHGVVNLLSDSNEDDGFKSSCRKLKIFFQDDISVNCCQSLYKK
jgi:hypothetical protein